LKEDQQLLFGTGANGQVQGFFGSSASGMSGFDLTTVNPNLYDLIAACAAKLAKIDYNANFALVNPVDYWKMVIEKDKDERYQNNVIFDSAMSTLYVFGIPTVATTAVPVGNLGIGDSSYVMPMQREGISLRFAEEDDKNFQQNLVTARVEERILQAVLRNDAFVYGSIATGKNAITATS
jgi:HK97 family phage major capsid protein